MSREVSIRTSQQSSGNFLGSMQSSKLNSTGGPNQRQKVDIGSMKWSVQQWQGNRGDSAELRVVIIRDAIETLPRGPIDTERGVCTSLENKSHENISRVCSMSTSDSLSKLHKTIISLPPICCSPWRTSRTPATAITQYDLHRCLNMAPVTLLDWLSFILCNKTVLSVMIDSEDPHQWICRHNMDRNHASEVVTSNQSMLAI